MTYSTVVVSTLADEMDGDHSAGDLSLREAIGLVADGGTITFDAALTGGLLRLTQGEIAFSKSVTLDGTGRDLVLTGDAHANDVLEAGTNLTDMSATSGSLRSDNSRILDVSGASNTLKVHGLAFTGGVGDGGGAINADGTVWLYGTTISGNYANYGYNGSDGGGVRAGADLYDYYSHVSGNASAGGGGGLFSGQDIWLTGTCLHDNNSGRYGSGGAGALARGDVVMVTTLITGNSSFPYYGASGGGVQAMGSITDFSSVISGNSASIGGGLSAHGTISLLGSAITGNSAVADANGGGIYARGHIAVQGSEISGNTAIGTYFGRGGGIKAQSSVEIIDSAITGNISAGELANGGGINALGAVTIVNSTIAGNQAGGADADGGGIWSSADITIVQSTITGNSAGGYVPPQANQDDLPKGGGVALSGGTGTLTVDNSIIVGNFAQHANAAFNDMFIDGDLVMRGGNATGGGLVANNVTILSEGVFLSGAQAGDLFAQTAEVFADTNSDGIADFATGIFAGIAADNGGAVPTVALLAEGAAIDGGADARAVYDGSPIGTDSRGFGFERFRGEKVDLGAFEVQNFAMDLQVADQRLAGRQWVQLDDVLTILDRDGDAPVRFELWDDTGSDSWWADGGYVDASAGYVTSGAGGVWFQAEADQSAQRLWVRADDGAGFGDWTSFRITEPNRAPDVSLPDLSLRTSTWRQFDQNWISDAEGDAIQSLELWDASGQNSWWADGGLVDASAGHVTNDPATVWLRSDPAIGQQTLWARAYDGFDWGSWSAMTLETRENLGPAVQVSDQTLAADDWRQLETVLDVTDPDDDPATMFEIWDSAGADNWWADGARVDATNGYQTADLAGIWFGGEQAAGMQNLWIRANDGIDWGTWETFVLETV